MYEQLTVEARDGRGEVANVVVTIKVDRDEEPPYFEDAPYSPDDLSENRANYSTVFTVEGKDKDRKVCTTPEYRIQEGRWNEII